MTSTDARQILARMVASVWIESTATNVNVAAVYMTKCFILVFTVKLTTVGVTPTLVRTVERASQTVAERVVRVNLGLKVIFVKMSTACQTRVFTAASASMNFSTITATVLTLATQESTVKLTSTNAHQTPVSTETALIN